MRALRLAVAARDKRWSQRAAAAKAAEFKPGNVVKAKVSLKPGCCQLVLPLGRSGALC